MENLPKSAKAGYAYVACSTYRIARELIVHNNTRPLYFVGVPTNLACVFVVPCATAVPSHPVVPILVLFLSALMAGRPSKEAQRREGLKGYELYIDI